MLFLSRLFRGSNFFNVRKMSLKTCRKLDCSTISGFLDSFDYALVDCDGVLWIDNGVIPGSPEAIKTLISLGKKVIYVTNNSTKTRNQYVEKFKKLGIPAEVKNIIPTSYCVAMYLKKINFKKKIYVIGSSGITDELQQCGLQHLPIGPDPMTKSFEEFITIVPDSLDPEVGAVVVGFDSHISYPKMVKASSYLKNQDNLFVAANADEQFPVGKDSKLIVPGTGIMVHSIKAATAREPIIVGKPTKLMFDVIKETFPELVAKRCIMIGDRLNSDILFGSTNGIRTVLVLSGIATLEDVKRYEESMKPGDQNLVPDYYLSCLGDLLNLVKK